MSTSLRRSFAASEQVDLENALNFFTNLKSSTKVRGNVLLQVSLDALENRAYKTGLNREHLIIVMDVVASQRFSDVVNGRLVKSLIPTDFVPESVILKAVFIIVKGTISQTLQVLLVRWMLLVYELLSGYNKLHAVYGIIFQFINDSALCPYICHLLYLMTRKEHVLLFRVRQILSLQQKIPGPKPYLMGLLMIYKLLCPHLVTIVVPGARKIYFPRYDRRWAEAIQVVQSRREEEKSLYTSQINIPKSKRAKLDIVPDIYNINTEIDTTHGYLKKALKVPIFEIQSFQEFVKKVDSIELPSQIGSVLKSSYLQHYITCNPDPVTISRFNNWLGFNLYEEFLRLPSGVTSRGENLFKMLFHFTDFVEEGIGVVDCFITHYLVNWNGRDYRDILLQLISQIQLYKMRDLSFILEPLQSLFLNSSLYVKSQILVCLTQLLRNYVVVKIPRFAELTEYLRLHSQDFLAKNSNEEFREKSSHYGVFVEDLQQFNVGGMLWKLVDFIHNLCAIGLELENDNALFMSFVLSFSELVVDLHLEHNMPFVVIPHKTIIYRVLASHNLDSISRLGKVMCRYLMAFDSLRERCKGKFVSASIQQVNIFNEYVIDVNNALWRHRMFKKCDPNSIFNMDFTEIDKLDIKRMPETLSLFQHPAFVGFTMQFIEKLPKAQRPQEIFHLKPLLEDYLEFLKEKNLMGIVSFMQSFKKKKLTHDSTYAPLKENSIRC